MGRKMNKTERKLQRVRLFMYTLVSFVLFQYIGIFALAEIKGIYTTSSSRLNAFSPKAYVSVELVEDDTTNHKYLLDENGYAFYKSEGENKSKSFYVNNPGTNKKNVVVRAKIIANICAKDGTTIGQTQSFEVLGEHLTGNKDAGVDMWYHPEVTATDKTDGTETKEMGSYRTDKSTSDTYFYYTSVLDKKKKTTNLFDDVRLTSVSGIPEDGWVEFHVVIDTVEVDTSSEDEYMKVEAAWGKDAVETLKELMKSN